MYSFSLPLPYVSCYCSPFCWCILMDDQLNEVVDSVKDGEPLLDSVLVHMGSMYSTLGKFEKSMSAYMRAVSNMENRYGKNSVFLTTPILGMAKVLSSIRRTSKAVESYNCAITLLESSRDLVVPLFGLGNLEQVHPSFRDGPKA
ncbi:hypothetical protein FF1_042101 [Malus domestica]